MSTRNKGSSAHINLDDPRFRIKPQQQVASACTGALVTSLFMTPLDVVKTRLQAQQKALISNKCFLYCNGLMDHLCPCGPNGSPSLQFEKKPYVHLNGTIDAFVKISRTEGIGSLWSGLAPTLVLALPTTVIYFVAYEQFKIRLKAFHESYISTSPHDALPLYVPLLAGVSARTLAVSLVSPLEMIRTKMQSQKLSYLEMRQSIRNLVQSQGILVLWKGLPPTIYRDVPFSGIYWTSYEYLKSLFGVTEMTFGFSFFAGAVSGSIAAFITTPFDVIKTHQQIEFGEKVIYADKPAKNIPSKTIFSNMQEIFVRNGLRGLFSGLGPRLAKVAPACAIMISSFEYGKSFFYNYNITKYLDEPNGTVANTNLQKLSREI